MLFRSHGFSAELAATTALETAHSRQMKFPAYPKYKPSGVEWLGDVPEKWNVKRLKYSATINDEALPETTAPDFEFRYVDIGGVDAVNGIVAVEEMVFENAPSRARRVVRDGDTIVSTVRTYLRAIAPIKNPPDNLIVSTGFAVVRPRSVEPDFLSYAICESSFIETVVARSTGVSYPAVNTSEVGTIPIPLPSPKEQQAIADFLDAQTARLDALLTKRRALIEKLSEKRTALISRTVTRGLNPKAKCKPSGVEWLGDIPFDWTRTRLKRVASVCGRIGFRGYTTDDLVDEGEGALALGGANLTDVGRLDLAKRTYISWPKYEESPEIKVETNDLLIGQRGTCGNVVIIDSDIGPATINPSLVLLKRHRINSHFLCYWMMGRLVQSVFETYLSTTAVPMLTQEQIGNVLVCVPPLAEQIAIVEFLDRETAKLDLMMAKVEAAIGKLQEYRTALITAAVTGKIDVRKAAA